MQGYYRFPAIYGDTVVFVSEDDLWSVPASGGVARRLTSNLAAIASACFSPDGKTLAFTGREEGAAEVYTMPAEGGPVRRVTHLGVVSNVLGWNPEGDRILFASIAGRPFNNPTVVYAVPPEGGLPQLMPWGHAVSVAVAPGGRVAIGRNNTDPARWKRYRGGTAGDIWVDAEGHGDFHRLIALKGNLARPMWIGDRVYFVSDHEGIGNLYSCAPSGEDLRRHTSRTDFYVRFPATDGRRIVYHAGANLYVFDPATGDDRLVEVEYLSPQVHRQRKFVEASKYLEGASLHPQGHSLAVNARGKSFAMGAWEGAVAQQHPDVEDPIRCRLTAYLNDGERLATVTDLDGVDAIELHRLDGSESPVRLEGLDLGRTAALVVSPTADHLALANHRNQLVFVDLEAKTATVVDESAHKPIQGMAWSPDGRWLAYGFADSAFTTAIRVWDRTTGERHDATEPILHDVEPAFDPEGKYLYFIGAREFNPVYDNLHFDLGFPAGTRPYLVTLRADLPSPFLPTPRPLQEAPKPSAKPDEKKDEEKKEGPEPVVIDWEGIANRVLPFPAPEGIYGQIAGIKGKAIYSSFPVEGAVQADFFGEPQPKGTLHAYDFKEQKAEALVSPISDFQVGRDGQTLLYRSGKRLRVVAAGAKVEDKPGEGDPNAPTRKTGWIDLGRIKLCVEPAQEWRQMAREAWRLQKEFFWTKDMSQIDWDDVWNAYSPLIDRVGTRGEFSDLVWEMQGELGTSHAYEFGGDYRPGPSYPQGFLGADFAWDEAAAGYGITHIVRGAPGEPKAFSPLAAPGVNVREGDVLKAIDGRKLAADVLPQQLLTDLPECEVRLRVADAEGKEREVTVKTLASELPARYREWVDANRKAVHEATGGKVGYVHIPDMGASGYAEFHRTYLSEVRHDALIVDVRNNRGGHVSPLILEKLARRRIGYDVGRWQEPEPYPPFSVAGPMVMLTDQFAGSDGDIVSHSFKLMGLGTLIGMRTWGGVIGIWPRNPLADGSLTTQPQFSFWFKDVGWGVENYGTDPDIEVDFTPMDFARGEDPQLKVGIEEVLRRLEANPPAKPSFADRPNLSRPKSL